MRVLFALIGFMLAFAADQPADAAAPARRHVEVVKGDLAQALDRQLTDSAMNRVFGGALIVEIASKVVVRGGWGLANR